MDAFCKKFRKLDIQTKILKATKQLAVVKLKGQENMVTKKMKIQNLIRKILDLIKR